MIRPVCLLLGLGALLSLAPPAISQITSSNEGYLFRMKFKQGSHTHYRMQTHVSLGQSRQVLTGASSNLIDLVVKRVDSAVTTIEMTDSIEQRRAKPRRISTRTITVDPLGKVDGKPLGGAVFSMVLPEKPVKVGQSVTIRLSGAEGSGEVVHHILQFVGVQMVDKLRVAHWKLTTAGKGVAQYKGEGDLFFDMTDCSLYRSKVVLQAPIEQEGKTQRLVSTTEIKRL